MKKPKTWVGNAGQDGVTTVASVVMMDKVIRKIRPKTVIFLAGGSDLVQSFSDRSREHGSPYDRAFINRMESANSKPKFRGRSRLYQEYRLFVRKRTAKTLILPQAAHKNWFPPKLNNPEDSLPPDSVVLSSLPAFSQNIRRIHSLALEMNIRIVFITQPMLYGQGQTWSTLEARQIEVHHKTYHISAATERRFQNTFNLALLSLCKSESMECFDMASYIPNDTTFFYDQGHFNDAGAALAANLIADYFLNDPPESSH